MFPTLSATTRAATFYLLALGSCVGTALLVPDGHAASVLAMLGPLVAVLLMQLVVTRDGWHRRGWSSLGLGRLGTRVWHLAVLVPAGILLASEAVVRVTGLTGWELPTAVESIDLLVGVPIMLAFVFCEEIGWRGYFGPALVESGRRAPHLVTGLLHGVWHLPLVFLATDGYLTAGNRWVIVPVFLAVMTCSGPVYGWLRETTGSVWPAVLAHASFNWCLGAADYTVTTSDPDAVAVLGREAGIATLIAIALAASWLTTRRPAAPSPQLPLVRAAA